MIEKKRIGRPPKQGDLKTRTVPFRCEEWLYRKLVETAQANGRTMSQEIAFRLATTMSRQADFAAKTGEMERAWRRGEATEGTVEMMRETERGSDEFIETLREKGRIKEADFERAEVSNMFENC